MCSVCTLGLNKNGTKLCSISFYLLFGDRGWLLFWLVAYFTLNIHVIANEVSCKPELPGYINEQEVWRINILLLDNLVIRNFCISNLS